MRIRAHIRSNIVGYFALFLVLTGGTAQALNGSNTVFSDDIVNRDVKTADLGPRAVTTNRLAPNAVKGGRVADSSLFGADIADKSLTRADVADDTLAGGQILEASLDQVPEAAHADNADNATNAANIADGSVTAGTLDTMTTFESSVSVPGGAAENGAYTTRVTTVFCGAGQIAIGGRAGWLSNANNLELTITEGGLSGGNPPTAYYVRGGNDSGVDKTLMATVYCLNP